MRFRTFVEKSSNFCRSVANVHSKYRAIIRRKIMRTKPEFRQNLLSFLLHSTVYVKHTEESITLEHHDVPEDFLVLGKPHMPRSFPFLHIRSTQSSLQR